MRVQRRGELHLVLALGRVDHLPQHRLRRARDRDRRDLARPWRRAYRRCAPARPCRAPTVSPAVGGAALGRSSARPCGRCPRPCRPRRAASAAPSPSSTRPASTRASESLPAWLVWIVFMHLQRGSGSPSAMPRRLRVSSTFGASWRSAFRSRRMPLPFSAEPMRTGTICPARSSAARSAKTLSRGGWMSSSSCSISASSWSASRSSMVKRASSRRDALAVVELDHLALRVLAVDEGAVEREVDEAGRRSRPSRSGSGGAPAASSEAGCSMRERVAHAHRRLVDLVQEQEVRECRALRGRAAPPAAPESSSRRARRRRSPRRRPASDRLALVVELHRAGAIEKRVAVVHERRFGDVELHAHRMRARLGRGIADRACRSPPRPASRSRRCGRGFLPAGWSCRWRTGPRSQCIGGPSCVHCRSCLPPCLQTGSSAGSPIAARGTRLPTHVLQAGPAPSRARKVRHERCPAPGAGQAMLSGGEHIWQGPSSAHRSHALS